MAYSIDFKEDEGLYLNGELFVAIKDKEDGTCDECDINIKDKGHDITCPRHIKGNVLENRRCTRMENITFRNIKKL